jgi:hypothetical protein
LSIFERRLAGPSSEGFAEGALAGETEQEGNFTDG